MLLADASDALGIYRDESMSFLQCYSHGRFDSTKFLEMRRKEFDTDFERSTSELLSPEEDDWGKNDPPAPAKKKKRQKRIILAKRSEDGEFEEIPPIESMWYHLYIACPQHMDKRFLQKIRRRFRLPY